MTWPALVAVDEADAAEATALSEAIEQLLAQAPSVHLVPVEETRRARLEGRGAFPPPTYLERCTTEVLPVGPAEGVPVRICLPADGEPRGVYLHIHGGGWTLGAHDAQDPALARIADRCQAAVVSVGYRLAPEHPFPAGADDCEAVARWVVEKGLGRFGTDRLVVGGESAGGHLSLVTALRLRDRHGLVDAISGLNLVFGAFDLTMTPSQAAWGDRNLILSAPIMQWFYDLFLPDRDLAARRDPEVSPLYADLFGLPPCFLTVGTEDPLLDDSLFLHARLQAADIESTLEVWPGAVHGFTGIPHRLAALANARADAWVASVLHG